MTDLITTLNNGLQVILREAHSAPVISVWLAYRIGSRNERTGQTGISHWVEHMMFKGTEKFPVGMLDREVDRAGGEWNAFTGTDDTMYYATLPATEIDLVLAAEADRMMNATFDAEETEAERRVIMSERSGSENSPMFWLNEAMRATAFHVHGYHHTVLGDMTDLRSMKREDLRTHYQQQYIPSNAILVAVGDFVTDEMLTRIKGYFDHLPALPAPSPFVRPEPEPQGERRVTVERPGMTAFLSLAHHVPQATHPDWYKLEVLDSVLTGAGGGIDNKTSRLYQALVKSGLAISLDGGLSETIDPYIYDITLTLSDGVEHAEAEAVLLAEIERIQSDGITDHELNKAKKQARAAFAYSSERVTNRAYWLAQSAILGDLRWYDDFLVRLGAVTAEDVQQVACTYLVPRRRVTGWLIPTGFDDLDEHDADETEGEIA